MKKIDKLDISLIKEMVRAFNREYGTTMLVTVQEGVQIHSVLGVHTFTNADVAIGFMIGLQASREIEKAENEK